jgi:hypothetical protein
MRENKEKEKQKLDQQCIGNSRCTIDKTSEEKILDHYYYPSSKCYLEIDLMDTPFSNTVSARYSGES